MLVGAVMGFWAVQRLDGPGGVVARRRARSRRSAGAAMALIHAFLVITLRANQIVSGLALTIFAGAAGLSSYLGNDLDLADAPARARIPRRSTSSGCADLPLLGPVVFGQYVLVYVSWAWWSPSASTSSRTRPGSTCAPSGSRRRRRMRWESTWSRTATRTPRGRRVRGHRRRVLQPGTHAAMGDGLTGGAGWIGSRSSSSRSGGPSSVSWGVPLRRVSPRCRSFCRPVATRGRPAEVFMPSRTS